MKTLRFLSILLFVAILCVGFSACSSDTEEVLEPEVQQIVKGTDTRDIDDRPYYWADGKKEYLRIMETSSFVVFYENDRESVYNSLSKLGIDCSTIEDFDYNSRTNLIVEEGSAISHSDGSRWMRVDAPYQSLKDNLPDAIYITPLVTIADDIVEIAPTNILNISYGGPMESLEEILKDYKVEIMGRTNLFNMYYIWCPKESESVGSPLEIANKIYESGKVRWSEPCFHGLGRSALL
jgi:hypothetical protein